MSTAGLTALISALASLLVAAGGVVALIRHTTGPAHKP